MGDCFRNFDEKFKILISPLIPVLQSLWPRSPVKGGIDFNCIELGGVEVQLLLRRQFFRKEKAFPVAVGESRTADVSLMLHI